MEVVGGARSHRSVGSGAGDEQEGRELGRGGRADVDVCGGGDLLF